MTRPLRLVLLALAALIGSSVARAAPPTDLVRADLVPEVSAIRPGETFTLGVRLTMRPGWHTYWLNPGDSGLPIEIGWTLPPGFTAGPPAWPMPSRIPVADFVNYGYAGEAVLLVPVTPPASLAPGGSVTITAALAYLACERECIPGKATVHATLTVTGPGGGGSDPRRLALFESARARLPVPFAGTYRASVAGETVTLRVEGADLRPDSVRAVTFFPYDGTAIDHAAEPTLAGDATGLTLTLRRPAGAGSMPARLDGVLALDDADGGVRSLALGAPPVPGAPATSTEAPAPVSAEVLPLWQAALLALLGGLILNLMPCVFPVLSIKVLALVRHAGESAARIRGHGLTYTGGVLAAFLGLAGVLLALRAGGAAVGWGYQLQSPLVVAGLALALLAVGLSLSGVFHVGAGLAGLGDGLARRPGYGGSFFGGVLAALVATPCTAPFMGTAVGFALTQSPAVGLTVFAALGLGLALPFLVLTVAPGLVAALPRPGAWMAVLKGALAFPVYATVAWLVWVVSRQVGPAGLMALLSALVLVGFAAWALGLAEGAGPAGRRGALAAALVAIAALAGPALVLDGDRAAPSIAADGSEAYSDARLAALRAEGRPVLVNVTAAWCITCLVNERTTLGTQAVRAALMNRGVALLTGDWTNQDPALTRLLERHGRGGVPLYLLYAPGTEARILPQILTASSLIAEMAGLPERSGRSAEARP